MSRIRCRQEGVALLLVVFLVAVAAISAVVSAYSSGRLQREQEARTQLILQQTKAALIAWSVTHRTTPGRLPCPEDTSLIGGNSEGNALTSCANSNTLIGRIPWRTLGLDEPRDASGEQLWYVLSPGFRQVPPLGSNGIANGQIQLDGALDNIAALIIAPGLALPGQTRPLPSATAPPASANFLDLGNAAGPAFLSSGPPSTFNDRVISLSTRELFMAMRFRVLAEIRGAFGPEYGLRRYHRDNGSFPATGTPLSGLYFDTATRDWLAPGSNPDLWFSQVTYASSSPSVARLALGSLSMEVIPCTATSCP